MKRLITQLNTFDYRSLSPRDQSIYLIVLKYIQQIPETKINNESSYWEFGDDFFILIESNNDENCSFFISIKDGFLSMQVGYENRAEYIFNKSINTEEETSNLIKAIKSFLGNKIKETLSYCNDKIIQTSYLIPLDNSDIEEYKIGSKFGFCLPLFKKNNIEKTFKSWFY